MLVLTVLGLLLFPFSLLIAKELGFNMLHSLPEWLKYPLTVLFFYPTIAATRVVCALTSRVRLYDRVTQHIVLGVAPVFAADVRRLHAMGVRYVVNCCREWPSPHGELYAQLGMQQLHVPTTDFTPPSLADTQRALAFLAEAERSGGSAYVHCKAGRGRSVCIVLAHLVVAHGLTPQQADEQVRAKRPNIAKDKWRLPLFAELQQLKAGGVTLRAEKN